MPIWFPLTPSTAPIRELSTETPRAPEPNETPEPPFCPKVPWGKGFLFEAVQVAIAGLTDPLQKATAEEGLERGDVFDRDGVFVQMLAAAVGTSDEQLDELMAHTAGRPIRPH
jgi:hypothetical protein